MGKSAKLHKRVPKKLKSGGSNTSNIATSDGASSSTSRAQVAASKKRSTLKAKTAKASSSATSENGLLGGADYVSLLMGGRKKAREEAKKLPKDDLMNS